MTHLDNLGQAMFENVALVSPQATLAAFERASDSGQEVATLVWWRHRSLLRSLAYDPALFERSVSLLEQAATQIADERDAKEAADVFVSLFTICLSGTHATIEQRLAVIERLLRSSESKERSLGLVALDRILEATHFTSDNQFEFGARSRDFGYQPRSDEDVTRWYGAALTLLGRLALTEGILKRELRDLLAQSFRGLWTSAHMFDALEGLCRGFGGEGFWREGWVACRETLHFDKDELTPESFSRLAALEVELRPSNLAERVRTVVLGDRSSGLALEDVDLEGNAVSEFERLETVARELGAQVVRDEVVLAELVPELLSGGNRAWAFDRGVAFASPDRRATWTRLMEGLRETSLEQPNVQVLAGYLAELWEQDRDLAHNLLDDALDQPDLVELFPMLQSAVQLDARSVDRLRRAINLGQAPIWMCRNLAYGRTTDQLASADLRDLLLLILDQPEGFDVRSRSSRCTSTRTSRLNENTSLNSPRAIASSVSRSFSTGGNLERSRNGSPRPAMIAPFVSSSLLPQHTNERADLVLLGRVSEEVFRHPVRTGHEVVEHRRGDRHGVPFFSSAAGEKHLDGGASC